MSVTEGESPEFFITPDEHSKVAEILADGEAVADICGAYQFEDVDQDHTFSIAFTHMADVSDPPGIDLKDAVGLLLRLADEDSPEEMENLIWVLQVLAGMTDASEVTTEESDIP